MIPAFSPFLALRYLVTRRINVLGACGVAFAVWAMLVVDGVFTGFVTEIRQNVRNSAPDLMLTDLPHDTGYARLCEVLEGEQGVVATAPRLRHHGLFQPLRPSPFADRPAGSSQLEFDHTDNGFALLVGIDPEREAQVTDLAGWLRGGVDELAQHNLQLPPSPLLEEQDPERRAQLLLPDEVEWRARRRAGLPADPDPAKHRSDWPGLLLGWRRITSTGRLGFGDPFDVLCASMPRADAALRTTSLRVAFAGWYATGNRMFDETTALLPIETLRTLVGHDAYDPTAVDLVTDVAIRTAPGLGPDALAALQDRLQQKAQAALPPGSPPCSVLDWRQQNSVFLSAVAQEQAMMQLVLFVVMLVSAFVIYATLHMMVVQKVKDIGILSAVGGSPRAIGAVFLISGTVVALVGTALGLAAGLLSAAWLNPANEWLYEVSGGTVELFPRRLFDLREVPCHMEPGWVVTVSVGAIVLALVVAFVPARKASRMNPVTALSYE